MSRIGAYLNQTATLNAVSGYTSASGKTTAATTIRCRFEPYTRQMNDAGGNIYTSQARIFTDTAVSVGDTITYASRTWTVRNVKVQPSFDGATDHYEAVL